jgi:hypothetical protein
MNASHHAPVSAIPSLSPHAVPLRRIVASFLAREKSTGQCPICEVDVAKGQPHATDCGIVLAYDMYRATGEPMPQPKAASGTLDADGALAPSSERVLFAAALDPVSLWSTAPDVQLQRIGAARMIWNDSDHQDDLATILAEATAHITGPLDADEAPMTVDELEDMVRRRRLAFAVVRHFVTEAPHSMLTLREIRRAMRAVLKTDDDAALPDVLAELCEAGTLASENRSGTVCFTLTTEANVICEDQADTVVTVLVDGGTLGAGPRPGIGGHWAVTPRMNGGKVCSTNEGPCACGKRHMPGDADVMANPFVSRSTV